MDLILLFYIEDGSLLYDCIQLSFFVFVARVFHFLYHNVEDCFSSCSPLFSLLKILFFERH